MATKKSGILNKHHLRASDFFERALLKQKSSLHFLGGSSISAISFLLSQNSLSDYNGLPNLVICSSLDTAEQIRTQLRFFSADFECYILRPFDVSPYSGLYPSPSASWDRSQFLFHASKAAEPSRGKTKIFIAPIQGVLQKTAPFLNFHRRCRTFKIGDELPSPLAPFLNSLGYQPSPLVEDKGQYSQRGGIVDIFPVNEPTPIRIELFGDSIESLKIFSPQSQLSESTEQAALKQFSISPVYEYELTDDNIEDVVKKFRSGLEGRSVDQSDKEDTLRSLTLKNYFPGSEFLLPLCYDKLSCPLDHFSTSLNIIYLDPAEISRSADEFLQESQVDYKSPHRSLFNPRPESLFQQFDEIQLPPDSIRIHFSNLSFLDEEKLGEERIEYNTLPLTEFSLIATHTVPGSSEWIKKAQPKFQKWQEDGYKIFVSVKNQTQVDRLLGLLNKLELKHQILSSQSFDFSNHIEFDQRNQDITLVMRSSLETTLIAEEKIIFLRDDDFFGRKAKTRADSSYEEFSKNAKRLSFGDLKPNDLVVHVKHGIGVYEGLKIMNVGGVDSEFIQISYKDKDKLYLPVYRVGQLQKFSGAAQTGLLDKLGGTGWEKTKIKVKNHLRDIAAELLQLYAKRSEIHRDPLVLDEIAYGQFERDFPFSETNDQLRAINEIQKDFHSEKPMDRLVCGDVGFGKTEVCMRAAFQAALCKKQVAVLAPTTVLSFQHLETFKKRFSSFENQVVIRSLNRFVSAADQKKTLAELKEGKVDILIGTHRLLSKDVVFKDLGLLVIDEEQKFGVTHKEKIKKMKTSVDTLTLSATPIPRTLNMSFTGIRDLSIINTAPVDRLPTRTFVSKFDTELIRKGITSELARGGQVYFIHNRVQSIYGIADEIRQIVPQARIKVAHGQMDEDELESAMLAFFHHEIDVLVCTAIVESGMDVPRANTMFIDQAHMFGLSQLYQLRGRVGRSKSRAYCYLLMPKDRKIEKDAQERLKIIQDNSALGSGIKIAQYDLELRGAGNILGDDQSGHVNSVGYEMYMDLLNEALSEARGETVDAELDPEINLRIPALIPDQFIPDIRIRLSYYKALADIKSQDDLDTIEAELRDQFGELPEPVVNLMGLMLIRRQCKNLGVRDISAGLKNVSLIFTEHTKLSPQKAIELTMRENKKYSLPPDQRLNIRMNNISWSNVYEELNYLLSLIK